MKESTKKLLTNIINFSILVLNGLLAMLHSPETVNKVASLFSSLPFIG